MKKLLLTILLPAAMSLGASAQLTVNTAGGVLVGSATTTDTTAMLQVANGDTTVVISLGEATQDGLSTVSVARENTKLKLTGAGGVAVGCSDNDVALRYNAEGFTVNVPHPISGHALYVAADADLNEGGYSNVNNVLAMLSTLRAKGYHLTLPGSLSIEEEAPAGDDPDGPINRGDISEEAAGSFYADSLRYGLDVTAVQAVMPNLVTTDQDGYTYIDYSSLVSLLVSAVNELSAQVVCLQEQINGYAGEEVIEGAPMVIPTDVESVMGTGKAELYQNRPNPFSENTEIRLSLPEDVSSAILYVYDLQGHQVNAFPISDRGNTSVVINGGSLAAGMYIYTLIADGKEIDTKRMILTK